MLLPQAARDVAERRNRRNHRRDRTIAAGGSLRVSTQRRAPSDEQEKRPSQNETERKRSKFNGVKKTPAESNARLRSLIVPRTQRGERIRIWPASSGARKSRCTRRDVSACHITFLLRHPHKAISGKRCLQLLGDHAALLALLLHH